MLNGALCNPLGESSSFTLSPVLLFALAGHAAELAQGCCEADNSQMHPKHYCALTDTLECLIVQYWPEEQFPLRKVRPTAWSQCASAVAQRWLSSWVDCWRGSVAATSQCQNAHSCRLLQVGRMVLDKVVDNFHNESEQIAFSPHNLVPGTKPLQPVLPDVAAAVMRMEQSKPGSADLGGSTCSCSLAPSADECSPA